MINTQNMNSYKIVAPEDVERPNKINTDWISQGDKWLIDIFNENVNEGNLENQRLIAREIIFKDVKISETTLFATRIAGESTREADVLQEESKKYFDKYMERAKIAYGKGANGK